MSDNRLLEQFSAVDVEVIEVSTNLITDIKEA